MFRQNKNKTHLEALATKLALTKKSSFGQLELEGNYKDRDIRISTFSTGAIGSGGTRVLVDASNWSFTEFRVSRKARAESAHFPDGYDITADNPVQFIESFSKLSKLTELLGNVQQRLVFNGIELEYVTTDKLQQDSLEDIISFLYDLIELN